MKRQKDYILGIVAHISMLLAVVSSHLMGALRGETAQAFGYTALAFAAAFAYAVVKWLDRLAEKEMRKEAVE